MIIILKILDSKVSFTQALAAIIITCGAFILALLGLDDTSRLITQSTYSMTYGGIKVRNSLSNKEVYWIHIDRKEDLNWLKGRDLVLTDFNSFAGLTDKDNFLRKNINSYYGNHLISLIVPMSAKVSILNDIMAGYSDNVPEGNVPESYVVAMDKYYRVTILSDLNSPEFYCGRINSLKKDIKPASFSKIQMNSFINYHLNNLYGNVKLLEEVPSELGENENAEYMKELVDNLKKNPFRDKVYQYLFAVRIRRNNKSVVKAVWFQIDEKGEIEIKDSDVAKIKDRDVDEYYAPYSSNPDQCGDLY